MNEEDVMETSIMHYHSIPLILHLFIQMLTGLNIPIEIESTATISLKESTTKHTFPRINSVCSSAANFYKIDVHSKTTRSQTTERCISSCPADQRGGFTYTYIY